MDKIIHYPATNVKSNKGPPNFFKNLSTLDTYWNEYSNRKLAPAYDCTALKYLHVSPYT